MAKLYEVGMKAPNFDFVTVKGEKKQFYDYSKRKYTVLFFSRYVGCPICQLKIVGLEMDYSQFEALDAEVLFVVQSTTGSVSNQMKTTLYPFSMACDPEMSIYEMFSVPSTTKEELVQPEVIEAVQQAKAQGISHGDYEGNEYQLPALFIVDKDSCIQYVYYGKNVADLPENEEIFSIIEGFSAGK